MTEVRMLTLLVLFALPAQAAPVERPAAEARAVEEELMRAINDYRASLGLSRIDRSPSLDLVARMHAKDLATHRPDAGRNERGQRCNSHSWSSKGPWTPACYTDDHAQARGMWNKPSELTRGAYTGFGYEIASSSPAPTIIPAAISIAGWKASSAHHAVISETGIWRGKNWKAIGVGVAPGYSVV